MRVKHYIFGALPSPCLTPELWESGLATEIIGVVRLSPNVANLCTGVALHPSVSYKTVWQYSCGRNQPFYGLLRFKSFLTESIV